MLSYKYLFLDLKSLVYFLKGCFFFKEKNVSIPESQTWLSTHTYVTHTWKKQNIQKEYWGLNVELVNNMGEDILALM